MRTRGQDPTLPDSLSLSPTLSLSLRDAPRAAAGDGGRDGYVLPRVGLRIHSSPQELIGSNSWSGESVSEVPPASIQVEVARLHAPRRNAGRQTRYRAAPTIHANPFHVLAEAA